VATLTKCKKKEKD